MKKLDSTTIFLLTVGQSGSSALAGIIHKLGIPVHDPYIGTRQNYYENIHLIRENKRLLGSIENQLIDRSKLKGIPRKDLTGILKDPRLIVTFPLWQKVYPDAKYIFLMRNTYDMALDKALFSKRLDILEQRVRFFYENIEQCIKKGISFLYVHYDMLSLNYINTLKRISEYCEVEYKYIDGWEPKYYGRYI